MTEHRLRTILTALILIVVGITAYILLTGKIHTQDLNAGLEAKNTYLERESDSLMQVNRGLLQMKLLSDAKIDSLHKIADSLQLNIFRAKEERKEIEKAFTTEKAKVKLLPSKGNLDILKAHLPKR